MAIRAVLFDIGGVLERVQPAESWLLAWRDRLGMSADEFGAAVASVDPDDLMGIGQMSEAEFRQRSSNALGLSDSQADAYMRDLWDWYCGELDHALMDYVAGLRPTYATAVLSNSGSGARDEEESRHQFSAYFDPILYSHEIGVRKPDPAVYELTCDVLGVAPGELAFVDDAAENIAAADQFGIHAVLHRDAASTIRALDGLLRVSGRHA